MACIFPEKKCRFPHVEPIKLPTETGAKYHWHPVLCLLKISSLYMPSFIYFFLKWEILNEIGAVCFVN